MKGQRMLMSLLLVLTLVAGSCAQAAEYKIAPPDDAQFAAPTSVEQVTVIGGWATEQSNIDRSKNAALLPPPFGSPESEQVGAGVIMTKQTESAPATDAGTICAEPLESLPVPLDKVTTASTAFTLPDGLFYSDGSLGRLTIPRLGVDVRVYETESLESLAKGAGHFKSTSCWDGNVGLAGHNRGVNYHFGEIHTLQVGDRMTYTTKLGTRTYEVFFVGQIEETDFSRLGRTSQNQLTLITCVRDVRNLRWCVQARETA